MLYAASATRAQEDVRSPHGLKPGDELYMHHYYHDIYKTLRKQYEIEDVNAYHNSCCNDGDCRVTLPFEAATPEQQKEGYSYRVFVDGKWCPARRSSLVTLSPEMRIRALTDPHIQDFLQKDHVCASYPIGVLKDDPNVCPTIYCIIEGGARS